MKRLIDSFLATSLGAALIAAVFFVFAIAMHYFGWLGLGIVAFLALWAKVWHSLKDDYGD